MPTSSTPGTATTTLRKALIATACIPLSLIAAFIIGEGLAALFGYSDPEQDVPVWVMLAAGIPGTAAGLVAPVAAFLLGLRARKQTGRRLALVPVILGGFIAAYWVLVSLLAPFA